MKKFISIVLFCTVLFFTGCDKNNENVSGFGEVFFTVIDGFSGMPIEGVKIIVPEANSEVYTDSTGKSAKIAVPVLKGNSNCVTKDFGTFTVLGYKEGYNEYALFFANIIEEQQRHVKMYMFKTDTPLSSGMPLATVESPDKDWVLQLVNEYKD